MGEKVPRDLRKVELARPAIGAAEVEAMAAALARTRGLRKDFPGEYLARMVDPDAPPSPRAPGPGPWPLRQVQLEVVNRCNYRCPLCKTLDDDGVTRRVMGVDELARVLGPVAGELTRVILYGTRGEPFLHPDLAGCVAWVKAHTGATVSISTNGSRLATEAAGLVLAAGLDELIVAVDGLTEESYRRYRRGGTLANVVAGIREVRRRRDATGAPTRIVFQAIPMAANEAELPDLAAFAYDLGVDEVRLKASGSVSRSPAFRPVDPRFHPGPPDPGVLRCPFGLEKVYVDPNGDVFPCCYTEGYPGMRVGNALETSLAELWNSDAMWELRRSFLEQSRFSPFCRRTCEGRGHKRKIALPPPPAGLPV